MLVSWTISGQLVVRYLDRYPPGKDVTQSKLIRVRPAHPVGEIALFVTHAPGGQIKPHVPIFLSALKGQGIKVSLIIATDHHVNHDELTALVDGLYIRQNEGFDFAAWAHVMQDLENSNEVTAVYLLNDSIIGPFNSPAFSALLDRIRSSPAELVCLTDSHEWVHHFQSYFLVVKGKAIDALGEFLDGVVSYPNKNVVIRLYELTLLKFFQARKFRSEVIFPAGTGENETMDHWRQLIDRGFPFVKAAALRDYPPGRNRGWREVLKAQGYDPLIAEQSLAIIEAGEAASSPVAP